MVLLLGYAYELRFTAKYQSSIQLHLSVSSQVLILQPHRNTMPLGTHGFKEGILQCILYLHSRETVYALPMRLGGSVYFTLL